MFIKNQFKIMNKLNNLNKINNEINLNKDFNDLNSSKIKFLNNKIFYYFFYIILALPSLFLLINKYPYFQIISVILIVIISLISFIFIKSINSYSKIILGILLIIFIYFILSYFFAGQSLKDFFKFSFLRNDGNFFFCYILFFALSVPFFNYKILSKFYFYFIFISFSIFAIIGIIEFYTDYFKLTVQMTEQFAGRLFLALNYAHNATGSVYAVVSIFALIFFLREKKKLLKILYLFILFLCIMALFLTKSRGSWLAFAVGVIFVLWLNYRSWKKFLITLSAMIVASLPLIFFTGALKRLLQIFNFSATATTTIRLDLWSKAWYLFSQSPIFGVGFGRYNDIHIYSFERIRGICGFFALYLDPNFIFDNATAHNSYLQFLAETGVIGLFLLMSFWIICLIITIRGFLKVKDEFAKRVLLSASSSIIVLFALSLTENYMSATTVMICISFVVSVAIGLFWENELKDKKYYVNINNDLKIKA